MRFLHTADWHLGRLFHGTHLTDDQAHVLEQFVALARESRPDAIVIAGDIYDRAVPPPEAVALLDDVLTRLVMELRIPTIAISGNHDSGERLQFATGLLRGAGLHLAGCLRGCPQAVVLADADGPVHFYPIPWAEPFEVRSAFADDAARDHETAMSCVLQRIATAATPNVRRVAIAHAFVAGAATCESERPITVGGAGTVPAASFAGFHYTALGHLHAPQQFEDGRVRYSGSLLKYSFDEAHHQKAVLMVEMDAAGACRVEPIALTPKRDVRIVEGLFAEVMQSGPVDPRRDDYVLVRLTDTGVILDAAARLREAYPNLLHIERAGYLEAEGEYRPQRRLEKLSEADLFAMFFRQMTGADVTEEQARCFAAAVDAVRGAEREATE